VNREGDKVMSRNTKYEAMSSLGRFGHLITLSPCHLVILILAMVAGCQQNEKQNYADVRGTVTFNGKPIEKGQITFAPEGRPPSTMDIVDGKFAGEAMVGENKIVVSARKKAATPLRLPKDAQIQMRGYLEKKKGQPGGPTADYEAPMVEYIPPDWGTQSKQTRVVKAGSANEFQFDIKGPSKN